jgi:hypothetical protein
MTRYYEEIDIDNPAVGTGEDILLFLKNKSSVGQQLIEAIENSDLEKMCLLSSKLGRIGYTTQELELFFNFIFNHFRKEKKVGSGENAA